MSTNALWGIVVGLGVLGVAACGDSNGTGGSGGGDGGNANTGGTNTGGTNTGGTNTGGTNTGGAGGGVSSGLENSHAGANLGTWMVRYFTWSFDTSQASSDGDRTYLPVPNGTDADGDMIFTGELDVDLPASQGFVLPLFAYLGETYQGGDPPDDDPSMPPEAVFTGTEVVLTLDGVDILDSADGNLSDYYFDATDFPAPIMYDTPTDYGSIGAIWVKGIGVLHEPLASGVHVLHLEEFNTDMNLGYSNTWNITVP